MTDLIKKEICGYTVIAKIKELHVDFLIHEDDEISSNEPKFIGYVKWDGCSNWHFSGDNYQLHFCSQEEAINFGKLIGEIYEWASKLLPDNEILE